MLGADLALHLQGRAVQGPQPGPSGNSVHPTLLRLCFSSPQGLHVSLALQPEPYPLLGWPPPSPKYQILEPRPQSSFSLPVEQAISIHPILLILSIRPHLTWFLGSWGPGTKNLPSLTLGNCLWGPGKPMPLQLGGCHFNKKVFLWFQAL